VSARLEMSAGEHLLEHRRRQAAPAARPLVEELPRLQTPTLIAWGNDDRGAAVDRGLALLQLIPRAELHVFRDCAHWVQWDQAERFNRLVADFLDAPLYAVASAACASGTST